MRPFLISLSLIVLVLTACTRAAPNTSSTPVGPATIANPNLPSAMPVMTYLPPTRAPGTPISSPTANAPLLPTFTPLPVDATQELLPTATEGLLSYTVQAGDFPGSIAEHFNIKLDDLLTANKMTTDSVIYPGDTLLIPGFRWFRRRLLRLTFSRSSLILSWCMARSVPCWMWIRLCRKKADIWLSISRT